MRRATAEALQALCGAGILAVEAEHELRQCDRSAAPRAVAADPDRRGASQHGAFPEADAATLVRCVGAVDFAHLDADITAATARVASTGTGACRAPATRAGRNAERQEKNPNECRTRRKRPRFHLADRRQRHGEPRRARRQKSRSLLLSEGRHLGLHRRGLRLSRTFPGLQRNRSPSSSAISKDSVASHDKFKKKHGLPFILASDVERRGLREVRHLGREEHVRAQIHGHRPRHLSDRRVGDRTRRLAQGQGAGPCRRSAEGGARPLTVRNPYCRRRRDPRRRRPVGEGSREPRAGGSLGRRGAGDRQCRAAAAARPAGSARCCARRARCRSAAPLARGPGGSRCSMRSPTLSSTRSIWPGTWLRALPSRACRAASSTIGSGSPPRRPPISSYWPRGLPISVRNMAICRPMTGFGKRRRRPPTTCWRGSPLCRLFLKRAGST